MSQRRERLRKAHPNSGLTRSTGLLFPIPQEASSLGSSPTWGSEICSPQEPLQRQAVQTLGGQTLGDMVRFMKRAHWFSEEDLDDHCSCGGTGLLKVQQLILLLFARTSSTKKVGESDMKWCLGETHLPCMSLLPWRCTLGL